MMKDMHRAVCKHCASRIREAYFVAHEDGPVKPGWEFYFECGRIVRANLEGKKVSEEPCPKEVK